MRMATYKSSAPATTLIALLLAACSGTVPTAADDTPNPVAPQVRVIMVTPDSTLIGISNPSLTAESWEFNPCPADVQAKVGGKWVHARYMIHENSACIRVALILFPGADGHAWVPGALPFNGRTLRIGIGAADPAGSPGSLTWIYSEPIPPPEH